jgi:hypothetical protein
MSSDPHSVQNHLESLKLKHSALEDKIRAEDLRPMPDTDILHRLKAEKLHLKEEIEKLVME